MWKNNTWNTELHWQFTYHWHGAWVLGGSPTPGQRDPEGSFAKKLRHELSRTPEQSSVFTAQLRLPMAWISPAILCWPWVPPPSFSITHPPSLSCPQHLAATSSGRSLTSLLGFSLPLFSRACVWELCWLPRKWESGEQRRCKSLSLQIFYGINVLCEQTHDISLSWQIWFLKVVSSVEI